MNIAMWGVLIFANRIESQIKNDKLIKGQISVTYKFLFFIYNLIQVHWLGSSYG